MNGGEVQVYIKNPTPLVPTQCVVRGGRVTRADRRRLVGDADNMFAGAGRAVVEADVGILVFSVQIQFLGGVFHCRCLLLSF